MAFGGKDSGFGVWLVIGAVVLLFILVFAVRTDYSGGLDFSGSNSTQATAGTNNSSSNTSFFGLGDANLDAPIDITSPLRMFDSNKSAGGAKVEVYFCPQDECANKLISKIDSAKESIFIAIYSFTQDDIRDAVLRAKQRGVEVKVIFDYDQSKNESSDDEVLENGGVLVERRNGAGYMHNKYAVIDGKIVATGSFNYSQNANIKNEENLVFIEDSVTAQKFKNDFDLIWGLAQEQ